MSFSWTRVSAILLKELRDYRRNRFVLLTMAATPVLFIVLPMIQLIAANVTGKAVDTRIGLSLIYMLVIPLMMPSVMSAYSVVGEREQGTLEPVLITPIRREEFLIGKALAVLFGRRHKLHSCISRRVAGTVAGDRVVPLAVELVRRDCHRGELLVRDLGAGGVGAGVELGADLQALAGRGRPDQLDDHLVAGEWTSPPVHRHVAPQPMVHPVPLAGARREVTDRDLDPSVLSKLSQLQLPKAVTVAVGLENKRRINNDRNVEADA
jgi:hypothetical protein